MASLAGFSIPSVNPEIGLTIGLVLLALLAGRRAVRWLGWWERPLTRLALRPRWAIGVAAMAPLAVRALLLPLYPAPEPHHHDEFSFLLAADALLHGRVANPPHPFWVHFESIHILTRPMYVSAFPLAPAIAMAAGKALLGHAWAGVWLSGGLMCGAICWMLQGWLPSRWALLGALLAGLRFAVASYWMNTYWGGFVAAAGGALALGALGRMRRSPRPVHGVVMGIGFAILANSRPVEGAVFAAAVTAIWIAGRPGWRAVLPAVVVLGVTGAGMAYYFARVTGKPWLPPYVYYRETRTIAPHFIWQKLRPQPVEYSNAEMAAFYRQWEIASYLTARQLPADLFRKTTAYWRFYLSPLLTLPLLALQGVWRSRGMRPLLLIAAIFPVALIGQVWHNAHYAAPATGLVLLIVMLSLRYVRQWRWRGRRAGLVLTRALPLACSAMLLIQIAAGPLPHRTAQVGWRWPEREGLDRARILRQLESFPGNHLVMVRYGPTHVPGDEWVYNAAEIDRARVVWARELDPQSNERLIRYFAGRQVWLAEPEPPPARLTRYADAPFRPMPFVPLGAPGIDILQSPEDIRRRMLEIVGSAPRSCYQWSFVFMRVTGIESPPVTEGCYGADRTTEVTLDRWMDWAKAQR